MSVIAVAAPLYRAVLSAGTATQRRDYNAAANNWLYRRVDD
jgi:hypothetical protein